MNGRKEYLRRNLVLAKSIGVLAGVRAIEARLVAKKRVPAWLRVALNDIHDRAQHLPAEIVRWRDSAPDAP